jgi:hypothetical protein
MPGFSAIMLRSGSLNECKLNFGYEGRLSMFVPTLSYPDIQQGFPHGYSQPV